MTEKKPKESEADRRIAGYSRTWHDGWVCGQIDKTESILATLAGLHEQATTKEGKAALKAAVSKIEEAFKRQFPEGRATRRNHKPPTEKQP
jgi:hypothetical protein